MSLRNSSTMRRSVMKKKTRRSQVSNLCLLLTYKVTCYNLSVTTYYDITTSTTTTNSEDIAKQWR